MTTKEFIKILQEADPRGDSHIRMDGGIPLFAELKEGYWDGPYSYLDEDKNYVYSSLGGKVDIHCLDLDDFIDMNIDIHESNNWGEVKSKFKFKLSNYSHSEDERITKFLLRAKKLYDENYEMTINLYTSSFNDMVEKARLGWTWFQNKLVDKEGGKHHFYTWKVFDENDKKLGSNIHNTESIQKSGKWKRIDNNKIDGYYEWSYNK